MSKDTKLTTIVATVKDLTLTMKRALLIGDPNYISQTNTLLRIYKSRMKQLQNENYAVVNK